VLPGRYNGDIESPRQLLQAIGIVPVEMKRSGMRSSCCGWGGGAAFTDVPGKRRIPDVRIEHAREVGAQVVAVACPNCAVMLEGVVAPRPAVLDLAELVQRAVAGSRNGRLRRSSHDPPPARGGHVAKRE